MQTTQQQPGKKSGFNLAIAGMQPGIGIRKRWENSGGALIAAALLKAVDASGDWRLILDRHFHIRQGGAKPTIEVRTVDGKGCIVVRIVPAGNDTAVTCRLVPPRTMPAALVAVVYTKMRNLAGEDLYSDGLTIDCRSGAAGSGFIRESDVTLQTPQSPEVEVLEADDCGELAEKHEEPSSALVQPHRLPPAPPPAPADDHDPAVRLMEAARQATALASRVEKLREIRAEIVAAEEKVRQLRRKESELVVNLDTAAFYKAIEIIEEAQADAQKFLS